jgi:hypothetical protein
MLISTVRLYERCLRGFESDDEEVQSAAQSCLSYLVIHLRLGEIVLPPELVPLLRKLPEPETDLA